MQQNSRDTYSKIIRLVKIVLPVVAIFLLVGVFALSNANSFRKGLVIPDRKMAELAIGQKVTNPNYTGVTKAGDAFSITATSALPDSPSPKKLDLVEPVTVINFTDGWDLNAVSKTGLILLDMQKVHLDTDVVITTSNHYTTMTDKLIIDIVTGNAVSPGPIHSNGPLGIINAGNMKLVQDLDDTSKEKGAILYYGKRVKVLYYPKQSGE